MKCFRSDLPAQPRMSPTHVCARKGKEKFRKKNFYLKCTTEYFIEKEIFVLRF